MADNYVTCTHVTSNCPVEATTYGYAPNLGVNTFFAVLYAVLFLTQLGLGIKTRTWTYTLAIGVGTMGEFIGYVARTVMHSNPWNMKAFEVQICCLVIAPSFVAAGIYLTLKHLVLYYGPQYSRLKPRRYPQIFIGGDIISIVVQAIGGAIAAAATSGQKSTLLMFKVGDELMVAGIAFQIAIMLVCGILVVDYMIRFSNGKKLQHDSTSQLEEQKLPNGNRVSHTSLSLNVFCASVAFAYLTILIRCVYRLPEMAGGWGNPLMRKETEFLLLDGMMVGLACVVLTVVHPGIWFPPMRK